MNPLLPNSHQQNQLYAESSTDNRLKDTMLAWGSEYDCTDLSVRRIDTQPWGENYAVWAPGSEQVDFGKRVFRIGQGSVLSGFSDESEGVKHSYQLELPELSQSQSSFWGKIVQKTWGSKTVSNGSDWKSFWGRRVITALTTAAAIAVPIGVYILSKSSATQGNEDESFHESTAVATQAVNATISSVATFATTALNLLNTTSTTANIINATTSALAFINATATPSSITNATMSVINWVFTQSSAPIGGWTDIAASALGQYLIGVQNKGSPGSCVYISSNYGISWNSTITPAVNWDSAAISSSGQYIVAVQSNLANSGSVAAPGYIYVSLDYGVTWTKASAPAGYWQSVTSSSSGQYVAAVQSTGPVDSYIYLSSNYGVTWTKSSAPDGISPNGTGAYQWTDIVSSLSGQYLLATQAAGGYTYTSSNYGIEWVKTSLPYGRVWSGITLSDSGQYLAALDRNNFVFISSDYGNTWIQGSRGSILYGGFTSIAASSSGKYLIIGQAGCGYICISSDYGVTWTSTDAPCANWGHVAISSCGQYLAADQSVGSNDEPSSIYLSSDYGITWNPASPSNFWGDLIFPLNSTQFIALGSGGIWTHQPL